MVDRRRLAFLPMNIVVPAWGLEALVLFFLLILTWMTGRGARTHFLDIPHPLTIVLRIVSYIVVILVAIVVVDL